MFDEFLRIAGELRDADERFAIAMVVRSEPPVSGKPGYKAIIRADGTMWGWIGGGCTQPLVIKEAMASLEDGRPRLVRITPEAGSAHEAGITEYTMTCHSGGALDVYVEPVLPRPHLLIFGRSLVAQKLARLAADIDYRVTVVASGAGAGCFQTADTVVERIEDCRVSITPDTFIVVATQGEDDEEALEQAALLGARYTAFVASRTKAAKVFDYLAGKGVSRARLGQIKAPAGLSILATTPEEIAVSILAEVVQDKASKTAAGRVDSVRTDAANAPGENESPIDGAEAEHVGIREPGGPRESVSGTTIPTHAESGGPPGQHGSISGTTNSLHAGSGGPPGQHGSISGTTNSLHAGSGGPPGPHGSVSGTTNSLHAGSVRSQEGKEGRARDPICGMEVNTEHSRHRSEYLSQTFYFCCARCKEKFDQSPDRYVVEG
jgi:xanthine dehydrogenase accessory factor